MVLIKGELGDVLLVVPLGGDMYLESILKDPKFLVRRIPIDLTDVRLILVLFLEVLFYLGVAHKGIELVGKVPLRSLRLLDDRGPPFPASRYPRLAHCRHHRDEPTLEVRNLRH